MKSHHQALLLVAAALIALNSYGEVSESTKSNSASGMGINAVLTANSYVAVQKRIREGKVDEATELIDAEYLRLLPQLRKFDAEIASESTVRQLRDRVVKYLQTRWLKDPPVYLDEQSAEYLERICATIHGCPKGRVHPLKEPVLPPLN
jgi:hypothetical protein